MPEPHTPVPAGASRGSGPRPLPNQSHEMSDSAFSTRFARALLDNDHRLCDAEVTTKDGATVPICRLVVALSCKYFYKKYLTNGKGPLRNPEGIILPISSDIFRLALEFFYSDSSFIKFLKHKVGRTTDGQGLRKKCRCLVLLAHTAAFLESIELLRLCATTISELIRRHPAMTCTALEAMREGKEIYNKEHAGLAAIRQGLFDRISADSGGVLQIPGLDNDETPRNCDKAGILQLSPDSLCPVVSAISDRTEFAFRAIFFWASKGTPLNEDTKECLTNPSRELTGRVLKSKEFIKSLALKNLKPEFVSSFVCLTGLVDRDTIHELYRSSLKKALADISRYKKKLRIAKSTRARTRDGNS